MKPTKEIRKYFSELGKKGGKKSKRKITKAQQKKMQEGRKNKRGVEK